LLGEARLNYICLGCGKSIRDKPSEPRKYCSQSCYHSSIDQRREKNYAWKGDAAKVDTGNDRARRWYPNRAACEVCGSSVTEIHHRDGNPLNNAPGNVAYLCRRDHMIADGRLQTLAQPSPDSLQRRADAVRRSYTPELRALRRRQAADRWRERPSGWAKAGTIHKVGVPVQRS
jgi:DNA-directed RNA polymerase subunit RPC12/RpoP